MKNIPAKCTEANSIVQWNIVIWPCSSHEITMLPSEVLRSCTAQIVSNGKEGSYLSCLLRDHSDCDVRGGGFCDIQNNQV